jgi:uncharacterized protein YbaR (Trm112 family)
MPADSVPSTLFDARVLEHLACPVCFGTLQLTPASQIVCVECRRTYPLVDGIPVLIPDRAVEPK